MTARLSAESADVGTTCPTTTCSNAAGKLVSVTYPGPGGEPAREFVGFDVRDRNIYESRELMGQTFVFRSSYDNVDRLERAAKQ